jgi:MFS transporter, DHA3 family, macrolide efflux protein
MDKILSHAKICFNVKTEFNTTPIRGAAMFEILKQGVFFRLWLAQVVSQLGDGVTEVAVIVLVASASHNGWLIGLVIFAQLLPSTVLGVFLGPLADRWSPKWLMVGADFYRMLVVLAMIPARSHVWLLLLLILLQGVGSAAFAPARSVAVPRLVGEESIPKALGLSQGTYAAMRIVGPALGGIFLALHQVSLIFMTDATTFLLSGVLIASLTGLQRLKSPIGAGKEEPYFRSLSSGIKQVTGLPVLRFLLLLLLPLSISAGMFNTDANVVLLNSFHVPALHFGLLETVFGFGAVLGAISGPFFLARLRPSQLMMVSSGLIGGSMLAVLVVNDWRTTLGLSPIYLWFAVVGYLLPFINVPLGSLFVAITPADFRGRGGALLQAVANGGMLAGVLLGGWVAQFANALTATSVAGIIMILAAVVCPWFRGYRELHQVQSRRPVVSQNPRTVEGKV